MVFQKAKLSIVRNSNPNPAKMLMADEVEVVRVTFELDLAHRIME